MNEEILFKFVISNSTVHIQGYKRENGVKIYHQPFDPFTGKDFEGIDSAKQFIKEEYRFDPEKDEETDTEIIFHKKKQETVEEITNN
jgi:hypothetical protein